MATENREVREAYVNWKLTPKAQRVPSTKIDFAKMHDVHRNTLAQWEKQEWFIEAIRSSKDALAAGWWGDIMNRLMDTIDNGSNTEATGAARVLLAHLDFRKKEGEKTEINEQTLKDILEAANVKFVTDDSEGT